MQYVSDEAYRLSRDSAVNDLGFSQIPKGAWLLPVAGSYEVLMVISRRDLPPKVSAQAPRSGE